MVLSILSLATRPCLMRRRLARSTLLGCSMSCFLSLSLRVVLSLSQRFLGDRGLNLGVCTAGELHPREVAQVSGAQREAQVEKLFLRLASALLELCQGHAAQCAQIVALHQMATLASSSARVTIFVEIGSFCAARRSASRAVFSSTPASSKRTRPGRTTATQNSGLPLPEPMRTSAGFLVTDLSGKILIHTLPPRLM